jgi:hypothetical protein
MLPDRGCIDGWCLRVITLVCPLNTFLDAVGDGSAGRQK